jgi:hypothetical protein
MSLHSKHIGGNLIFYNNSEKRIVSAVGPDVVQYFEDFVNPVATSDALVGWTTTLVEAGAGESTVTVPDAAGGTLLLTTDANEDDGINFQKIGENFKLSTSQQACYFGIRFKISDKTQSDFIVGLCITDTALLGGMTDGVYFRKVDGAATVNVVTEKNSTETETLAVSTMVNDTYVILEWYWDGTSVEFFVDGVAVAQHTANIVDDEELTPSIHFLAGEAVVKTMTVDWIRAVMVGR